MADNTIRLDQLGKKAQLFLTDLMAVSDSNGVLYANKVQDFVNFFSSIASSDFKGSISAGTYATKDAGWYFASDTGNYIMGATTIAVDVSDTLTIIIVPDAIDNSSKVEVPITINLDAVPTDGSTNAVQSGGVFDAIATETTARESADAILQDNINFTSVNLIGKETDLLKINKLVDGSRIDNSGNIITDGLWFRTFAITVVAGERYSSVSSEIFENPRFSFFNSATLIPDNQISLIEARDATVPAGATFMCFQHKTTQKASSILQKLTSGFPILADKTFDFDDVYKKEEVDAEILALESKDVTLENSIKEKLNISNIGVELNLLKTNAIVDGSRVANSGFIINDASFFRTVAIPVTVGKRYATVSTNTGINPRFSFYSSSTIDAPSFISLIESRSAVAPVGATHLCFQTLLTIKEGYILKQLDEGFPVLNENTIQFTDLYKKQETEDLIANKIGKIANETDLLKLTTLIDGSRPYNDGSIGADGTFFRSEPMPITAGLRYAAVSSNLGINPIMAFYSSSTPNASTLVRRFNAGYSQIAPSSGDVGNNVANDVDATHLVFSTVLTIKSSIVLRQLDEGFPILGDSTFIYEEVYTKKEVAKLFPNNSQFYPDTFELDINYVISNNKIYVVDENETLFGSNGFRTIIKATNPNLSDAITVCTLDTANSVLWSLVKVSNTKFVGYVVNPITPSAEGFYIFTNADTNSWTQTKAVGNETTTFSKMLSGFPDPKFQNFFRIESNGYIFACSYSSPTGKDGNPDPVDPAPVHIYRSIDDGTTWTIVYTHPSTLNAHIHAVEYDIYRDRVWGLVGDANLGGTPRIIYSDDYGTTWGTVKNKDGVEQQYMGTSIIPTRKYVLFGSDQQPASIWKWEPKNDGKNEVVYSEDIDLSFYEIPIEGDLGQNFGFSRRHGIDISSYPYKIVVPFSHTAEYSKAGLFLSPNFRNWYMLNFEDDPINNPHPVAISHILSNGLVIGWGAGGGNSHYFTFQFPNWINN